MKSIYLVFAFYFSFSIMSNAQDSLVVTLDNQLIQVSQVNASYSPYVNQTGMIANDEALKLTWCEQNNCFYTCVFNGALTNQIGRITTSGVFTNLGVVTIPGETVHFIENISFDEVSNELYCSASLNGSPATNDWYSESFIRIDTANLTGVVVGNFSHPVTVNESESDDIAIGENGMFFYVDVKAGASPYRGVWTQDVAMSNPPTLIYEDFSSESIIGMEYLNGNLYFTADRVLHKINTATLSHSIVGTIFTISDFNGSDVRGLSKFIQNTNSIEDLQVYNGLILYPNPNKGSFNIEFDGIQEAVTVNIRTLSGKLVETNSFIGTNRIELTIEGASGVYFVELIDNHMHKSVMRVAKK